MGWMFCGQDDLGRDIGYGVDAVCDFEGCKVKIDRGLGYICGDMHCDTEKGCARYFCEDHRYKHDCPDRDEYEVAQETDLGELGAWARIRCQLCVDGTPRPEKCPTGWVHPGEEGSETAPCTAGFVWDRIVELEEHKGG